MNNEQIARMKTVEQCFAEIKKLDENTAITSWFIRRLCKENKVKHFIVEITFGASAPNTSQATTKSGQ